MSAHDSQAIPDPAVWRSCHGEGDAVASEPGYCVVSGKVKSAPPTASGVGVGVTRHPRMGAARERRVSARELVETRAVKETIPPSGNRRLAQANLLILKQGC